MSICFHCVDRSASGLREHLVSCVTKCLLPGGGKDGVLVSLALKAAVPSQPIGL